jgi:REP element-mobilizing transposase RayT
MGPLRRGSVRLPGFDYTSPGAYFVTVCTREREFLFGDVVGEEIHPSRIGQIVTHCWDAIPDHFPWVGLDVSVVMPNHIHGILVIKEHGRGVQLNAPTDSVAHPPMGAISPRRYSLGLVIRTFKAAVTTEAKQAQLQVPIWQRGYYEHIIRGQHQLERARAYIATNPQRWELDKENSS